MTTPREAVAGRIRQIRQAAGLTGREMAALARLSGGHPSLLETCRRTPTAETLSQIAQVFGVTVDWLLHGGPMPSARKLGAAVERARANPIARVTQRPRRQRKAA